MLGVRFIGIILSMFPELGGIAILPSCIATGQAPFSTFQFTSTLIIISFRNHPTRKSLFACTWEVHGVRVIYSG